MDTQRRYRPRLRPAPFGGMPIGVHWEYVEAPPDGAGSQRVDLPRSRHHFGVVCTERALTAAECEHFDLKPV